MSNIYHLTEKQFSTLVERPEEVEESIKKHIQECNVCEKEYEFIKGCVEDFEERKELPEGLKKYDQKEEKEKIYIKYEKKMIEEEILNKLPFDELTDENFKKLEDKMEKIIKEEISEKVKNYFNHPSITNILHPESFSKDAKQKIKNHLRECKLCEAEVDFVKESLREFEEEPYSLGVYLWNRLREIISDIRVEVNMSLCPQLARATRTRGIGMDEEIKEYRVGEEVEIEIKSSIDGYLTIFHYDEDKNLSLVFPTSKEDNTKVKKGETKIIKGKITKPVGKKCFKIIITKDKIIDENIVNKEEKEKIKEIENFIEELKKLNKNEFIEYTYEYKVKNG